MGLAEAARPSALKKPPVGSLFGSSAK